MPRNKRIWADSEEDDGDNSSDYDSSMEDQVEDIIRTRPNKRIFDEVALLGSEKQVTIRNDLHSTGRNALRVVELQTQGTRALQPEIKRGDTLLLDFFAGCGGATQGFVLAGFKPTIIVEAAPFKQKQYENNFPGAHVHERPPTAKYPNGQFIYEATAEEDARIMVAHINQLVGGKKVRYHVHASPSCVALCAVGRKKKKKQEKDSLSDSLGTFKWTCEIIKLLKRTWGSSMTWSIEDSDKLMSPTRKIPQGEGFITATEMLTFLPEPHLKDVWDFTLWGVPQDRRRTIVLDGSLNIGTIPGRVDISKITDAYLAGLIDQMGVNRKTRSEEDREKVYHGTKMKDRISIRQAFDLAMLDFPEGVTSQMSQASLAQAPSLARVEDPIRLKLRKQMEKEENYNTVMNLRSKYGETYYQLTKKAYVDLLAFIQQCDPDTLNGNIWPDDQIQTYLTNAYNWCKDLTNKDMIKYVRAMVAAIGQSNNKDIRRQRFAFATTGNYDKFDFKHSDNYPGTVPSKVIHSNIPLSLIIQHLPEGLLRNKIRAVMVDKKTKTKDLRDKFGLLAARFYSPVKKKRDIDLPAFSIQAQSDKTWYRPIFRPDANVNENLKIWHSTQMKFSFMTIDQLKALGTFPLAYDFEYKETKKKRRSKKTLEESRLEKVRYGIGDSVPPLVTLRLGLMIKDQNVPVEKRVPVPNITALNALHTFTSNGNLMQNLFNDFKLFLKKQKTRKKGRTFLSKETQKQYMKEVYNHFAEAEFLGKGMLIGFALEKKTNANRGFDQAAAFKWIDFLEEAAPKITPEQLKTHIRRHRLWTRSFGWVKKNRWAYNQSNQTLTNRKKREAAKERQELLDRIDDYDMTDKSKERLNKGFTIMLDTLGKVFTLIAEVRTEEAENEERDRNNSRATLLLENEVIDLTETPKIKNYLKF